MVKYSKVDGGKNSAADKLSKSRKIVKNPKNLKGLESLQRPLVWSNIYQSIDLLSIRYNILSFR